MLLCFVATELKGGKYKMITRVV